MTTKAKSRILSVALMVAVLTVYGQVMDHEFINLDDGLYATHNDRVQGGLSWSGIRWAFTTLYAANWHPLTWLSLMTDHELYGLHPGGFHLTNLLLHLATTLLLFLLLREGTGRVWESAVVAALFGIHPLHVESVAWVSERKDVLSALFWVLALLAYGRYAQRPGLLRYGAVLGLFVLGLLSKPMVVTLPFVLLLWDHWPLERWQAAGAAGGKRAKARLLLEKIPFFLLSAASCVVTYAAQARSGAVSGLQWLDLGTRLLNALLSYVRYLGKLFWPKDLAIFYPYGGDDRILWHGLAAGLLLLALTGLAGWQVRRRPWLAVGWLWFLGTLVPVIGLVQVGAQSMADRYTYIPAIGVYAAVVWGVSGLAAGSRWRRAAAAAAAGLALATLGGLAWHQAGYLKDSKQVFLHAVRVTRGNYLAHNNLGVALAAEGSRAAAFAQYEKALESWPDYADALANVGLAYADSGLDELAVGFYERAVAGNPRHVQALINLGNAKARLGRGEEARGHFRQAAGSIMDTSWEHSGLALSWAEIGGHGEAEGHLRRALELAPGRPEIHNNLGRVLVLGGKREAGIEALERAVELKPDFPEALNNLGLALWQGGWLDGALWAFVSALRQRPDYEKARDNLGQVRRVLCRVAGETRD